MERGRSAKRIETTCGVAGRFALVIRSALALATAFLLLACPPSRLDAAPRKEAHRGRTGNHYDHLFGQTYRTKVDLYVFIFEDDHDHVYLGRNDGKSPGRVVDLPAKVDAGHVGRSFGRVTVLELAPAGSEFTITAETHEVTTISGIRDKGGLAMSFIGLLKVNDQVRPGVLSEFIQIAKKTTDPVPNQEIDPAIAVRAKS